MTVRLSQLDRNLAVFVPALGLLANQVACFHPVYPTRAVFGSDDLFKPALAVFDNRARGVHIPLAGGTRWRSNPRSY
jgi:hypothetical protein